MQRILITAATVLCGSLVGWLFYACVYVLFVDVEKTSVESTYAGMRRVTGAVGGLIAGVFAWIIASNGQWRYWGDRILGFTVAAALVVGWQYFTHKNLKLHEFLTYVIAVMSWIICSVIGLAAGKHAWQRRGRH